MENNKSVVRIVEFDYIRIISLIGILVCHSCFLFGNPASSVGRYFALTFNFLFLALSAFLFGMSWESKSRPAYDVSFVKRRVAKLSRSYYPFLLAMFLYLYLYDGFFSWQKVIAYTMYLSWFVKIPGFGHTWFLTMIVLCYIGVWGFTKCSRSNRHNKLVCSLLVGGGLCADYIISLKGLPGYLFPYLIAYIWIFSKASSILETVRKVPLAVNIIQFVIINVTAVTLFYNGLFEKFTFWSYLVGMICAGSVFTFVYDIFKDISANGFILWLSGISFEIYLVHEFFIGRFNVYDYTPNILIGFVALLSLSILSAVALHKIALRIDLFFKTRAKA